ncbi:putative THOC5 family protein [Phialemonium atrogriseum]|uniref:THOC5 family protein n=1 Tax=Phialemonium atrogriseum TaxID=1093897 RepID=A0AAJ0FJ50_9PEZI|nr:putative THOC5 family protein [Phialemonium atrogriseum]KAK1769542.1 putative THOC5 family protein [Phialemonium atrogriseum]
MAIDAQISDPSLASVLETSSSAREQALALVELVAEAHTAAGDGPLSSEVQAEISKQQKLLNTNLSRLRGLHRAACFGARDTKAVTAEARQEVDRLHLLLQNLYYEQRHLEDEIQACEGFDHKYQQLPLIPVEEFLAQHPEHADADENALMVARIDHERAEREALEQQRQELLKRKQKLIADNKKRRDDLANLDKDLEKFIDAAKPIQKLFEKVV